MLQQPRQLQALKDTVPLLQSSCSVAVVLAASQAAGSVASATVLPAEDKLYRAT